VRDLAIEEKLPFIDLSLFTQALWDEQGEEESKRSFLWLEPNEWSGHPLGARDDTHLSAAGARLVAGLVARDLAALGIIATDA
jgi:lysophospholipase L1-like esterase